MESHRLSPYTSSLQPTSAMLAVWLLSALVLPSAVKSSTTLRDISTHLNDFRLPRDFVPVAYHLELVPHLQEGYFTGEVWINVTCEHGASSVVLHAHGELNVTTVAVYVNPLSDSVIGREIEVKHVERDVDKQWLIIMLAERLRKQDSYRLHLTFVGSLDNEQQDGLFRRRVVSGANNRTNWYASTNMKMNSARRIFPCFDEPEYKAVFDVKVGTTARQHVFSNMPLAEIVDMPRRYGWYWKHFMRSPPMAAMSFGMFLFEFEHYSLSKGVLRVLGRTEMRTGIEDALEHLEQVYEFFLDYLGIDNPLPKLDLVIVPDYVRRELIGSFGLIAFNEENMESDKEKGLTVLTVGQWVGHIMTPQWWGELDVTTGLIVHLSQTFLEKKNYVDSWEHRRLYYEYGRLEPYQDVWAFREYGNTARAAWFFRMIQHVITEETFMTGLRKFLQMRQYDTFSEHDLWTTLTEHAWNEFTLPKEVLIEEVAKSWLTKDRCPVITVSRNYGQNTATVEQHAFLKKKFYRASEVEQMLWYIPIMYLSPDSLNVSAARPVAWMKNQRTITIKDLPEPHEFIVVNPAEIGMFMVNYDPTNWALLADALQRKLFSTAVRAQLLHDAWNLAFAGELNFNSAMNMTLFLKDETEYTVWEVTLTMFDHIGRFLDGTSAGDKFKRYVTHLANRAVERTGSARWHRNEDRNAYNLLKYILRRTSNKKPTQRQRGLYEAWARGNGDSSSKTLEAMCLVLKHGTMEEFERGLQRAHEVLKARQDPESFGPFNLFSNCAVQPEKIERLLSLALLGQNTAFSDRDRHRIMNQLTGFYAGYSTMFYFLRQNWEALRQALEDKPDLWVELVEDAMTLFKTEAKLKEAAHMFAEKRPELGNAAPAVQAGIEVMTANVQWSKENVPVLERWLDQHLPAADKQDDS